MICDDKELSANDLAAMRLTNKGLQAVATKIFGQRYLQDPFVMILEDSLKTLVEICKHPVFGPRVRKIQLLNNLFDPQALGIFAQKFHGAHFNGDRTKLLSAKRQIQCLADLVAEQFVLMKSGAAFELLKRAFQILGAQGKPVAIASQMFKPSNLPIGWSKTIGRVDDDQVHWVVGMPEVLSTLEMLLKAAQAGACAVLKLEAGVYCVRLDRSVLVSRRSINASLLLGVQEFDFQFEWRNQHEIHNSLAYSHLLSLLRIMPKDLKTLTVRSDAVISGHHVEPHSIRYSLVEGLYHEDFTTEQPCALETLQLSKLFLTKHNLLEFLDRQRNSLKKLILSEVYLHGEWDDVLSYIARAFSLEQFDLRKARKLVETPRNHGEIYSTNNVPWYTKNCEVRGKDNMRQDLTMFLELQETERQAKEAETRAQALRPNRQAVGPLRRSKRIAENRPLEDQHEEQ